MVGGAAGVGAPQKTLRMGSNPLVYFDINAGGKTMGRITFELFQEP